MTRSRYRIPTTAPVSAWARHLDAYARVEGLSVSGLFRLLRNAVGLGPESRTAFRAYLVDKEPSEEHAKALAAIVGWPPAEDPGPVTKVVGKPADLATAVALLAGELTALREERAAMREERAAVRAEAEALRTEREAWERGVLSVLRAASEGRVPSELLDALVPQPLGSAPL